MRTDAVTFEGHFKLWVYDVSHGRLLLCRNPDSQLGLPDRVEVLFYDVNVVELCTYFDGLKIEKLDNPDGDISKIFSAIAAEQPGINIFKITTKTWIGTIIAAGFQASVNGGHYYSPSEIYKPGPVMKLLAANGYELD